MPKFRVFAKIVLNGASMEVEARDEDEAKKIATQEPDFEMAFAELVDFDITDVEEES